jgi:hypothetical protein
MTKVNNKVKEVQKIKPCILLARLPRIFARQTCLRATVDDWASLTGEFHYHDNQHHDWMRRRRRWRMRRKRRKRRKRKKRRRKMK